MDDPVSQDLHASFQICEGKIYLAESLLSKLSDREVLAVLCNEIGHLKSHHKIWTALFIDLPYMTLFAILFDLSILRNACLQTTFGFEEGENFPLFLQLVIFCHIYSSTVDPILRLYMN